MKAMATLLFVLLAGALETAPALAQTGNRFQSERILIAPMPWLSANDDTCLWNKAKKRRECHSRYEWRRIAAAPGAQQPRPEKASDVR